MPRRREFILGSVSALVSGGFPVSGMTGRSHRDKPNVLLVLSDQERENVPRNLLSLPNRQRLESQGIRFSNAYCTTPQCSASRASILTGLYPHEAGVITNVDSNSLGRSLSPRLPCLGNVFKQNGYATGYLGKWHLGPTKNGLDAYGFSGYRPVKDDRLGQSAAQWITRQTAQPWLLVTSFLNPHDIYHFPKQTDYPIRPGVEIPRNFDDDLSRKPAPHHRFRTQDQGKVTLEWKEKEWLGYRSFYLELIEKVDKELGMILDALEETKQLDNTIVIYASDHGDLGGAHRLPYKGPCMYEELLNVPLVISAPKRFKKPVESDALVSLIDIVPTLCDLTGIQWPSAQSGKNLSPLFERPRTEIRREIFAEYYSKQNWIAPIRTIRTQHWKYNLYLSGGEELYDLREDPGEIRNLAANPFHSDTRNNLAGRLDRWRRETGDPFR